MKNEYVATTTFGGVCVKGMGEEEREMSRTKSVE
jgi:hypothetical protein